MILHTLNAPPSSAAFRDCLACIGDDDALVLLGDGCYAAIPGTPAWDQLCDRGAGIYALEVDIIATGLAQENPGAVLLDMDGLVELTERYPRQLAWY